MPRGPRYRYFSNPPKTIGLRLGDLSDIPSTAFTPFYNADRRVEVPAEDILGGPVPKISFARLAELVPDAFQVGIHSGVQLRVPASRLALSYQLVESRELIEEPVEDLPLPPPVEETFALLDTLPPPTGEKFAPVVDDLPPPPTAKDLPKEPGAEESSFKPKLPPIAPPAAPVAKIEPVEPPAPKPPLPEIAPPAAAVPIPEPPKPAPIETVAPAASAAASAPQEPLPTVPAPAAITPAPEAPKPEPPPVAAKVEPPAAPIVEALKPLPRPIPVIAPPAPVAPVQETTPPPAAPAPVVASPEPVVPPPAPSPEQVAPPAPIARRPFSLLPIFRRKVVEPPKPIVAPEPRARVEIPKPKKPLAPLTSMNVPPVEPPAAPLPPKPEIPALAILKEEPAEPKAPLPEARIVPEPATPPEPKVTPEPPRVPVAKLTPEPKAPAPIPVPPPVVLKEEVPAPVSASATLVPSPTPEKSEAIFVETEHFPQGGKDVPAEIPEQDSLQALFLTEDVLSVERVIELCNGLPGIKSCILTRSGSVVNARNVPDSIDLISLSANALEMFRALRGSCAKMGIGAVPAVTMHSQKGPITFFHEQDICLLVLHKDRGFVPGVREKLQMVVEELSKANLLLPVSERGTKELK